MEEGVTHSVAEKRGGWWGEGERLATAWKRCQETDFEGP